MVTIPVQPNRSDSQFGNSQGQIEELRLSAEVVIAELRLHSLRSMELIRQTQLIRENNLRIQMFLCQDPHTCSELWCALFEMLEAKARANISMRDSAPRGPRQ